MGRMMFMILLGKAFILSRFQGPQQQPRPPQQPQPQPQRRPQLQQLFQPRRLRSVPKLIHWNNLIWIYCYIYIRLAFAFILQWAYLNRLQNDIDRSIRLAELLASYNNKEMISWYRYSFYLLFTQTLFSLVHWIIGLYIWLIRRRTRKDNLITKCACNSVSFFNREFI